MSTHQSDTQAPAEVRDTHVAGEKPRERRTLWQWGVLWSNRRFMQFWIGETISLFGSQVTLLALPLTAVLALNASAEQLGLLRFLEFVPYLLFPLFLGVWVDRQRRLPMMIMANSVRAILIGLVPLLALFHLLHLYPLYAIAFAVGVFTLLFDLCWQAFVPVIVPREHLFEANSKVSTSYAAAEVGGPGLAGALVQLITAPIALLIDSLSYVVSVVFLLLIRVHEPVPQRKQGQPFIKDIGEGLRFAYSNPYLRTLMIQAAAWNFFFLIAETIFLIYAIRELGFSSGLLGLIYAVSAVGGLLGAAIAGELAKHIRLGLLICAVFTLGSVPMILIPAASGSQIVVAAVCIVVFFLIKTALGTHQVLTASLRQAVTPDRMMGRVVASLRMISYSGGILGAIVSGFLGTLIGLRATLWLAGAGFILALIPIFFSPIPRLEALPEPVEEEAGE